jgi:hypothetical protein
MTRSSLVLESATATDSFRSETDLKTVDMRQCSPDVLTLSSGLFFSRSHEGMSGTKPVHHGGKRNIA